MSTSFSDAEDASDDVDSKSEEKEKQKEEAQKKIKAMGRWVLYIERNTIVLCFVERRYKLQYALRSKS